MMCVNRRLSRWRFRSSRLWFSCESKDRGCDNVSIELAGLCDARNEAAVAEGGWTLDFWRRRHLHRHRTCGVEGGAPLYRRRRPTGRRTCRRHRQRRRSSMLGRWAAGWCGWIVNLLMRGSLWPDCDFLTRSIPHLFLLSKYCKRSH